MLILYLEPTLLYIIQQRWLQMLRIFCVMLLVAQKIMLPKQIYLEDLQWLKLVPQACCPIILHDAVVGTSQVEEDWQYHCSSSIRHEQGGICSALCWQKRQVIHYVLLYWPLTSHSSTSAHALVPTDSGCGYRQPRARLGRNHVRAWKWMPFTNSARQVCVKGLALTCLCMHVHACPYM